MKRVFVIHKWGGNPDSDWYQWLARMLTGNGYDVHVPEMPDTEKPRIHEWVSHLAKQVGRTDKNTYLVGHSMGAQAILRYLEGLGGNEGIGGALFVAGFLNIKKDSLNADEWKIMDQWVNTRIDLAKASTHSRKFVSIFSGNDPYVPLQDSKIFATELGSRIVIILKGGHFTTSNGGYREHHAALSELLNMMA